MKPIYVTWVVRIILAILLALFVFSVFGRVNTIVKQHSFSKDAEFRYSKLSARKSELGKQQDQAKNSWSDLIGKTNLAPIEPIQFQESLKTSLTRIVRDAGGRIESIGVSPIEGDETNGVLQTHEVVLRWIGNETDLKSYLGEMSRSDLPIDMTQLNIRTMRDQADTLRIESVLFVIHLKHGVVSG